MAIVWVICVPIVTVAVAVWVANDREAVVKLVNAPLALVHRIIEYLSVQLAGIINAGRQFIARELNTDDGAEEAHTDEMDDSDTEVWSLSSTAQNPSSDMPPAHQQPSRSHVWKVVGAVFLTVLTVLFSGAELYLNQASLAPMLGEDGMTISPLRLPLGTLLGISLLCVALLWGAVFADAKGWTHFLPVRSTRGTSSRLLQLVSLVMIMLVLALSGFLGCWRGWASGVGYDTAGSVGNSDAFSSSEFIQMGPDFGGLDTTAHGTGTTSIPAETTGPWIDEIGRQVFHTVLPGLILISLVPSGVGLVYFLKYAIILVLWLFVLATTFLNGIAQILMHLLNGLAGLLEAFVDCIARLGQLLMATFSPPLRAWRDRWHDACGCGLADNSIHPRTDASEAHQEDAAIHADDSPDDDPEPSSEGEDDIWDPLGVQDRRASNE